MLVLAGCAPGVVESVGPVPASPTVTPVTVKPSPSLTPSPSPSPSSTQMPSPSPASTPTALPSAFPSYPADLPTEDPELAAIVGGWQAYQRVYEKFASDPFGFTDFTETQYVTTGFEGTGILERIEMLREENLALAGGMRFSDLEFGEYRYNSEGARSVVMSYCFDIDELEVRDLSSGELVERSGRFVEEAFMTEGRDGIWRVEGLRTLDETC